RLFDHFLPRIIPLIPKIRYINVMLPSDKSIILGTGAFLSGSFSSVNCMLPVLISYACSNAGVKLLCKKATAEPRFGTRSCGGWEVDSEPLCEIGAGLTLGELKHQRSPYFSLPGCGEKDVSNNSFDNNCSPDSLFPFLVSIESHFPISDAVVTTPPAPWNICSSSVHGTAVPYAVTYPFCSPCTGSLEFTAASESFIPNGVNIFCLRY